MKTINRVLTALLAAAMALSLSVPALAVSEDLRRKYRYNFDDDSLGLFQRGGRDYASPAVAALAERYGKDTEEYIYALAGAGIITISVRSADWFDIYAGPYYPNGRDSVPAGTKENHDRKYADVLPEAWYYDAVTEVSRGGLMFGDDSGLFRPDGKVTAMEFATLLCRVYNLSVEVFSGPRYGPYIDAVTAAGLDFSSCKYERASEHITRGEAIEAMTVMLRARGEEPVRALTWDDVEDAGECGAVPEGHGWSVQALLDALNYGVIDGTNASHRVNAAGSLTRAELCKILQNIGVTSARSVDSHKATEVRRQYAGR